MTFFSSGFEEWAEIILKILLRDNINKNSPDSHNQGKQSDFILWRLQSLISSMAMFLREASGQLLVTTISQRQKLSPHVKGFHLVGASDNLSRDLVISHFQAISDGAEIVLLV